MDHCPSALKHNLPSSLINYLHRDLIDSFNHPVKHRNGEVVAVAGVLTPDSFSQLVEYAQV